MDLKGHIATSLFALYRFPFEGEGVLKYLDATAKGVFRSFYALLFCLPVFSLITWLQFQGPDFTWATPWHIPGLFGGYVLAAIGFAFLVFHAQGAVGPRQNYLYFLPLYNWGRVVALTLMVPYFLLEASGVLTGDFKIGVLALSLGAVLFYKLSIARAALGVNYFHGTIFVLFDILMIMLFDALIIRTYGAFL